MYAVSKTNPWHVEWNPLRMLKLFTGLLEELTSLRLLGFLVRYTRFHRQYPIVSPINGCTQYVPGPGASQLSLQESRPVFGP